MGAENNNKSDGDGDGATDAKPEAAQPIDPRFAHLLPGESRSVLHCRTGVYADGAGPAQLWGLALSGGGIRSATFCLGVLQSLAKAGFNLLDMTPGPAPKSANLPLLARFDFLSTVSGGGYIGGFFSALFRSRGQAVDGATAPTQQEAADAAYAALASDPPGRMGSNGPVDTLPKDQPLRWLRENGRYLTPNGAGDWVLDIAIALRNLCAVHYVIGITLLTIFLIFLTFRYALVHCFGSDALCANWSNLAGFLERHTQPVANAAMWWSPGFMVTGAWAVIVLVPLGVAYWLHQERPSKSKTMPDEQTIAAFALLFFGVLVLHRIAKGFGDLFTFPVKNLLAVTLAVLLCILAIAVLEAIVIKRMQGGNTRLFRSKVTRYLGFNLAITFWLLSAAVVETAGQTLYWWLVNNHSDGGFAGLVGTALGAVMLIRKFSPMLAQPGKNGLLAKMPINVVLTIVGIFLLLVLLIAWHVFATAVFFGFQTPSVSASGGLLINSTIQPWPLLLLLIAAAATGGYFLVFINLSSLQVMYSARLTRAYLGASNKNRFRLQRTKQSVTEPHLDDDMSCKAYYANNHLGPAHIVNVTINATTGSGDQLTQRDRQGIPLAVSPAGVTVDGQPWTKNSEKSALSIGQWIGISGAAFSTGIGRGTSLGTAITFSLTNVRLGWWWDSGKPSLKRMLPVFRNQIYLMREMRAKFLGTDDSHWYLSDGGHYENTAVLELLRRRLHFVVCCDCGADPNYSFQDLANLMRLARIDHGAEFESIAPVDVPFLAERSAQLDPYFANTAADLRASQPQPAGSNNKCALLYKVTYPNAPFSPQSEGAAKHTILLVIKPRLIDEAPLDLHQYKAQHADFPQQSTADQFFDEAQWESYRKLGVLLGSKIFG